MNRKVSNPFLSRAPARPIAPFHVALQVTGLCAAVLLGACGSGQPPLDPPSVLLVTIDTLRADRLGCAGRKGARTPNIDALAAGGVYFSRAVSPLPLTLPSHASILTGLTPPEHGLRDNAPLALSPEVTTLAETLRDRGYETAAFIGGQPLAYGCGLEQGFDLYDFPLEPASPGALTFSERPASEVARAAMDWLAGNGGRPFFVWVHFFDPHQPYRPPPDIDAVFPDSPYDAEIAAVDRSLGPLVEACRARAGSGRLLCVLCADHGEGLGDHGEPSHGFFVFESTVAVPLILTGPGIDPRSDPDHRPARLIDIVPTVLDLLDINGGSMPGQGISLARESPGPAYIESLYTNRHFGWAPLTALRVGDLKLIDDGEAHLFDLGQDPGEHHDLAGNRMEDVERLQAQLDRRRTARPVALGIPSILPTAGYLSNPHLSERTSPTSRLPSPLALAPVVGLFESAVTALSHADTTGAIQSLEEARRIDPDNPAVLFWMARAVWSQAKHGHGGLKKWADAIDLFDQVRSRWPWHVDALNLAIQCRAAIGRFVEAVQLGEEAVESGLATAATREILGAVYLETRAYVTGRTNRIRDPDRGIALLEQARAGRETAGLLQKLARAYRETRQTSKARNVEDRLRALSRGEHPGSR